MTQYFGLEEICARMGWKDLRAPVRNLVLYAFPMYKRRRGKHPRQVWFTHERLITLWETQLIRLQRENLKQSPFTAFKRP